MFFLPRRLVVGRSLELSDGRWVDPARLAVLCVVLPYVAVLVIERHVQPVPLLPVLIRGTPPQCTPASRETQGQVVVLVGFLAFISRCRCC